MEESLKEKTLSITRLKSIFGIKTESARKLTKLLEKTSGTEVSSEENQGDKVDSEKEVDQDGSEKSPKGHGRRQASDYKEAQIIQVAHELLKKGSICPECKKGKLFNLSPGTVLRITG